MLKIKISTKSYRFDQHHGNIALSMNLHLFIYLHIVTKFTFCDTYRKQIYERGRNCKYQEIEI